MTHAVAPARVRPPALVSGDTLAAVSPAGLGTREGIEAGIALVESWGLGVEVLGAAFLGHASGFLAADDEARLADLNTALADDRYAGVICIRGGYGSQRLLDGLDVAPLRERPKALIGYSDITALHTAIGQRAGIVTFHGPNLEWNPDRLGEASAASLGTALMGGAREVIEGEPLVGGRVSAPVVGGNLTLLSTLCGTPDQPDPGGCVLFIEDIGEESYRMDRSLVHLRRAGVLDGVVGLVFDDFHACVAAPGRASTRDVAAEHAAALGVPAVYGLPLGHGKGQRTIALGALATLDGDRGTLQL